MIVQGKCRFDHSKNRKGVTMIWDEVFFELIVPFDRLVSMKKILWGSSHHIETHIDMFVEVIEVHISVSFEFYLDEEFIEFW